MSDAMGWTAQSLETIERKEENKLRKTLARIEALIKEIEEMEGILNSRTKLSKLIIKELEQVISKYGKDRRTEIISADDESDNKYEEEVDTSPVTFFFTKDGYFKKITPQSLRMSGEQKLKEGDEMVCALNSRNSAELLFFTDKCQVYKSKASEFDMGKASVLGDFVGSKLQMEEGETAISMAVVKEYKGYMLFFFENISPANLNLSP